MLASIIENQVTGIITPILVSETKLGLWKTSSNNIKKMKEVHYVWLNFKEHRRTSNWYHKQEWRGLLYWTVINFYFSPIRDAAANIILKKEGNKPPM